MLWELGNANFDRLFFKNKIYSFYYVLSYSYEKIENKQYEGK